MLNWNFYCTTSLKYNNKKHSDSSIWDSKRGRPTVDLFSYRSSPIIITKVCLAGLLTFK